MRRGVAEELLESHDRHAGLRAVHAEGVTEVVDRRIGLRNARGIPTAIVKLRGKAGTPKLAPSGAVVAERGGKDQFRRASRQTDSMRRHYFGQGLRDRHVARTTAGL